MSGTAIIDRARAFQDGLQPLWFQLGELRIWMGLVASRELCKFERQASRRQCVCYSFGRYYFWVSYNCCSTAMADLKSNKDWAQDGPRISEYREQASPIYWRRLCRYEEIQQDKAKTGGKATLLWLIESKAALRSSNQKGSRTSVSCMDSSRCWKMLEANVGQILTEQY